MSRLLHRQLGLPLMLLAGLGMCADLRAQSLPATAPATNAPAAALPVLQSPLALFRELLAMPSAQREEHLASWVPEKRAQLTAKIQEYEAMTPEAREQSLVATEKHWYLQQFLLKPSPNTGIQLSQVPEPYRKMVSDRLTEWKLLPPPLQHDVLAHESTRDFFLLGNRPPVPAPDNLIPPPLRQELHRLDNLPPEQRRQIYANFQSFFELNAAEKQAVLDALPAAERQQIKNTIAGLDRLPREQRDLGLRALDQLAGLTDEQRRQFFDSVGRWKQLSPAEQETWLKLARHLPPLPPMRPPMPPAHPPVPTVSVSVATNPSD